MRIGIDLDNTIIFYDDAFVKSAAERGLIRADFKGTKQQVRDHIRTLPDGETEWQKLQGYVYGQGMKHASLFPGVFEFITRMAKDHELFIISHKTEFGHFDETKTNLRDAALSLLESLGFFNHFKRENISFHTTRSEKVDKIASLSLDWFIDDLIEVYEEKHFPHKVKKILFHSSEKPSAHWQVCCDWHEIGELIR